MSQQLPLLIKEKLNFYINYKKWRDNLQRLHQDYRTNIKLVHVERNDEYKLCYHNNLIVFIKTQWNDTYFMVKYMFQGSIHSFINLKETNHRLPKKYVYSSGKDSPYGYQALY